MNLRDAMNAMTVAGVVIRTDYPLAGCSFVITGKLEDGLPRTDAAAFLVALGAGVRSKVEYTTTALLAVDPSRRTQKRVDADRYRVAVLNERAFVSAYLSRLITPADADFVDAVAPLTDLRG